jgi:hypothetical protein
MTMNTNLCLISIREIGFILYIAVILFGIKAVTQNPFINNAKKTMWIITILVLNWIGLLWYYYTYYIKDSTE